MKNALVVVKNIVYTYVVFSAIVFLCSYCFGCGPSYQSITARYAVEADICRAREEAIASSCHTQSECRAALDAERARCNATLTSICTQGRKAERACNGHY